MARIGPKRFSAVSGRTLRYTSWLGGRTSATTSGSVIQPPPGATTMFPTSVSSSVSSRSLFRKVRLAVLARRSGRSTAPRAARSPDRSRETCDRSRAATACPTVVFPEPGRPTRIRCGFDGSAAEPGCDVRKVGVIVPSRFAERIAAELLEERVGEHERKHPLRDDPHGGHGGHVAALGDRGRGLAGRDVDRARAAA